MTTLSNNHRALIVVDVQNDYDGGGLPIEHPPFRDSIGNIARAMDVAAAAGIQIVVVKQLAPETSPIFAAGSHGGALHPEIATRKQDHSIGKTLPSAFAGTDLEEWLRSRGITTITIVGYMTHNCDLATAIDATQMGFNVELLSDATGSLPYKNRAGFASAEEIHRVVLVVLQARFAAVGTTAEWREAIARGEMLTIDGIGASNLAALEAAKAA